VPPVSDPPSAPAAPAPASPPELARSLDESGYTPPTRALRPLLMALVDLPEEHVKPLERALARAGAPAVRATLALLPTLQPAARPRLFGLLVRVAGEVEDPALYPALLSALDEPVVQSRKLAARGLGKLGESRAEARLLEALEARGKVSVVEQKSIVDALGSLGSEASAARLAALASDDADLVRRRERARLLIERRLGRGAPRGGGL
jgi:HEAT repeat protein